MKPENPRPSRGLLDILLLHCRENNRSHDNCTDIATQEGCCPTLSSSFADGENKGAPSSMLESRFCVGNCTMSQRSGVTEGLVTVPAGPFWRPRAHADSSHSPTKMLASWPSWFGCTATSLTAISACPPCRRPQHNMSTTTKCCDADRIRDREYVRNCGGLTLSGLWLGSPLGACQFFGFLWCLKERTVSRNVSGGKLEPVIVHTHPRFKSIRVETLFLKTDMTWYSQYSLQASAGEMRAQTTRHRNARSPTPLRR